MRYSILILLFVTACSNSPVDSPGGGGQTNNGTLLIDRSGIVDSVYLDSTSTAVKSIFVQSLNFQYDTIRISFNYAGNTFPYQYMISMRDVSAGYFYYFGENITPTSSYQSVDTSFALSSFNSTVQADIGCSGNPANNVYFTIKDLKIYGK